MFSVFIQRALQDFSPVLENLLYPLKEVSFIFFCVQKQQRLKSLQYQCLYPHGSACITDTQRGIFQPERQKHTQRSNPFLMTLATWKLAGVRGEREVMLAPFRLAGDSLAGINWLQLCCHFWPEWQFGRALRCKKQSSNLFPSPALLPTATLFLLTSGWCSLPLFVCASACTPFPVVVAFERHQCLLHLAPVSVPLPMAVKIQGRFQQKNNGHHFFLLFCILMCGWHWGHGFSSLPWDVLARIRSPIKMFPG